MPPPPRPIVGGLDDPWAVQPAVQCKAGQEPVLTWGQASKADSGDTHEPRLLRDDLNVAEGMQHANVLARQIHSGWLRLREQGFERKLPTRVPQVAANHLAAQCGQTHSSASVRPIAVSCWSTSPHCTRRS